MGFELLKLTLHEKLCYEVAKSFTLKILRIHQRKQFLAFVDSFVDLPRNEKEYNPKK